MRYVYRYIVKEKKKKKNFAEQSFGDVPTGPTPRPNRHNILMCILKKNVGGNKRKQAENKLHKSNNNNIKDTVWGWDGVDSYAGKSRETAAYGSEP